MVPLLHLIDIGCVVFALCDSSEDVDADEVLQLGQQRRNRTDIFERAVLPKGLAHDVDSRGVWKVSVGCG